MRSRKFYFILGIFSFLFLEAVCNVPGNDPVNTLIPGLEENTICREDSLIVEEKSSLVRANVHKNAHAMKGDVSLLSFNFIYYVIYKFMYIEDIFELNKRPSNTSK